VLQPLGLARGLVGHLGVVCRNELADFRELVLVLLQAARRLDDAGEALVLPAERREQLGVANGLRVQQLAFDVVRAAQRLVESIAEAQAPLFVAYFCRKRSTRPAVSISFCLPVKNGWQLEQMSVWISATVERVSKLLPHAQVTRARWYSGWMSVFTGTSMWTLSEADEYSRFRR
jgi:hypothetical protein